MPTIRAALLGALLITAPIASSHATALPAPHSTPGLTAPPPPQAVSVLNAPPRAPATSADRARLRQLAAEARSLKRRMWRLRMRRRQFRAQGMSAHAHRAHKRFIALGWRLRRVQTAERALRPHATMSRRR